MTDARALVGLGALTLLIALLALCVGPDGVSLPWAFPPDLRAQLLELRGARVALAVVVGAGLACAGAVLQSVLRNPLADPYVLGVSGGAALGAALAASSQAAITGIGLSAAATAGALAAVALLLVFLLRDDARRAETALLVGITLNAFSWAAVAVMRAVVPAAASQSLSTWLIGSLANASARDALIALLLTSLALAGVLARGPALLLLAAGEDEAARLGLDVRRAQLWFLVCASVLVGAAVATSGVIGFLGLIAPHAVRVLVSRDLRAVLWGSALLGALVLVALDAAARGAFVVLHSELPTGALCAAVGAPLFAVALWRRATSTRRG